MVLIHQYLTRCLHPFERQLQRLRLDRLLDWGLITPIALYRLKKGQITAVGAQFSPTAFFLSVLSFDYYGDSNYIVVRTLVSATTAARSAR